jgi:hypothetical protein
MYHALKSDQIHIFIQSVSERWVLFTKQYDISYDPYFLPRHDVLENYENIKPGNRTQNGHISSVLVTFIQQLYLFLETSYVLDINIIS